MGYSDHQPSQVVRSYPAFRTRRTEADVSPAFLQKDLVFRTLLPHRIIWISPRTIFSRITAPYLRMEVTSPHLFAPVRTAHSIREVLRRRENRQDFLYIRPEATIRIASLSMIVVRPLWRASIPTLTICYNGCCAAPVIGCPGTLGRSGRVLVAFNGNQIGIHIVAG